MTGIGRRGCDPSAICSVAEAAPVDTNTLDFVRLAVFFAWHVASTTSSRRSCYWA